MFDNVLPPPTHALELETGGGTHVRRSERALWAKALSPSNYLFGGSANHPVMTHPFRESSQLHPDVG
jgi:hypothetical protein